MKHTFTWAILGWLFLLPATAFASNAYIGINLVLRSGPDIGYPRVMTVPAGSYVQIYGCISDYSWCDVGMYGTRGWVAATYLQYYDNNGWVYLPAYGPRIGIPVVTFVLGTYWGTHYRHTSWYRDRYRWERHPPRTLPLPRRSPGFHPRIPPPARPAPSATRHPGATRTATPVRSSNRADRTPRQQVKPKKTKQRGDHR